MKAISDPYNLLPVNCCHICFNGRIHTGEVAVPRVGNSGVRIIAGETLISSTYSVCVCIVSFQAQVWRYPAHTIVDAQIMTAMMPPEGKSNLG